MLPKNNRADKKAVDKIFKDGVFLRSFNLSLKYILEKNNIPPKISFVVPKSVEKMAVKRNLLRRRGYAVLKKFFDVFPTGFVGVFIFGNKSKQVFAGKKNKIYNPIVNLENEIKNIINKL